MSFKLQALLPALALTTIKQIESPLQHNIFVVTVALGGMDLVETLRTRYIGDDALKALLRKQIPAKYLQKNEKRTKKQFGEILMVSGEYNNVQATLLHKKTTKSAKCTKCKITITRCTNCFVVDGALTVPFNSGKADPAKFLFLCGTCLHLVSATTMDEHTSADTVPSIR